MSPKNVLTDEKIRKLILETILEEEEDDPTPSPPTAPPAPKKIDALLSAVNAKEKRYVKSLEIFGKLNDPEKIKEYLPGIRKVAKYFKENLGAIGLSTDNEAYLKELITAALEKSQSLKIPDSLVNSYYFLEKFISLSEDEKKSMKVNAEKSIKQIEDSPEYQMLEGPIKDMISTKIKDAKENMPKSEEEKGNIDRQQYSKGQISEFKSRVLALILTTCKSTNYSFGISENLIEPKEDYKKLNSIYERHIKKINFGKDLDSINNRLKNSESVITPDTFVADNRKNINTLANFIDIFWDCANLEGQMGKDDQDPKYSQIFDMKNPTQPATTQARTGQLDAILATLTTNTDDGELVKSLQANVKAGTFQSLPIESQVMTILKDVIKTPKTKPSAITKLKNLQNAITKSDRLGDKKYIKNFKPAEFTPKSPSEIIDHIFFKTETEEA